MNQVLEAFWSGEFDQDRDDRGDAQIPDTREALVARGFDPDEEF